jgi:hypothetical protein
MSHRVAAALGVAALLATAGCAGGLGGDDGARTPYDVPSATPTTADGPGPAARAPPELLALLDDQAGRLRSVGSYTLRLDRTVRADGRVTRFRDETFRVDAGARRGLYSLRFLRGERGGNATVSVYRRGGTVLTNLTATGPGTGEAGSLPLDRTPANESVAAFAARSRAIRRVAVARNGTAVFDGERLARYTAAGPDSVAGWTGDLDGYRLTVLVDDRGLVRRVVERRMRVTDGGTRFVVVERLSLTAIGTTTVTTPEWAESAGLAAPAITAWGAIATAAVARRPGHRPLQG